MLQSFVVITAICWTHAVSSHCSFLGARSWSQHCSSISPGARRNHLPWCSVLAALFLMQHPRVGGCWPSPQCLCGLGPFCPRGRTGHFPSASFWRSLLAHFSTLLKPLWIPVQPPGVSATPLHAVSSANLLRVCSAPSSRLLINVKQCQTPYWPLSYTVPLPWAVLCLSNPLYWCEGQSNLKISAEGALDTAVQVCTTYSW